MASAYDDLPNSESVCVRSCLGDQLLYGHASATRDAQQPRCVVFQRLNVSKSEMFRKYCKNDKAGTSTEIIHAKLLHLIVQYGFTCGSHAQASIRDATFSTRSS